MSSCRNFKVSLIALAVSHSLCISSANAATINVDGSCALRDAIVAANTDSISNGCPAGSDGADTIVLGASSTITLTDVDAAGNGLAGLPVISSNITIQGNASTITRDITSPDFRLITMGSGSSLYLDSISLNNGSGFGSAINASNANTLVLTNSTVSNNSATASGAGIFTSNTDVLIDQSSIINNTSPSSLAGIAVQFADLVIHDSVITGNSTTLDNSGVFVDYGSLEIIDSVVSQNTGRGYAGIRAYNVGNILIEGSEVESNTGRGSGLNIYNYYTYLDVQISSTNINSNNGEFAGLHIRSGTDGTIATQANVSGCQVIGNQSDTSSSGFTINAGVSATIDSCQINQNIAGGTNTNSTAGLRIDNGSIVQITGSEVSENNGGRYNGVFVNNNSSLTLENSTVSNNTGLSSAFHINQSVVSINESEISSNSTSSAYSPMTIVDSTVTIDQTSITSNASSGRGGAMRVTGSQSNLTLLNSTVANNVVESYDVGGGLYLSGGNDVTIANTTISGNQSGEVGGLYSTGFNSVALTNVTIANNVASEAVGGISFGVLPVTLSINNTLFSNNTGGDCDSQLPEGSGENNWFQDDSCNGVAQGDPLLLELGSNGGLTSTHALEQNSPVIDQGNSTLCAASPVSALDQRGETRDSLCDIGAYELQEEPESVFVIPAANGKVILFSL